MGLESEEPGDDIGEGIDTGTETSSQRGRTLYDEGGQCKMEVGHGWKLYSQVTLSTLYVGI